MTYEPVSVENLLTHQDWALRLARRLVREEAEAEDLVQRTWMAALRRPPNRESGARAWIHKVILNLAREHHRRRGTRERLERALPRTEGEVEDALEVLSRSEIRKMLSEQLLELAEPYRSAVLQRYYDGLSSVEIARRLGIPAGTVRWRLKVGLDQLRSQLDQRANGDRSRWVSALLAFAPGGMGEAGGAEDDAPVEAPPGKEPAPVLGFLRLASIPLAGAGILGLLFLVRGTDPDAHANVVLAAAEAPADAARDQGVQRGATSVERVPLPLESSGPGASSGASGFGILVVDEHGVPVHGARVLVASAGGFEDRTVSDAEGRAVLVVRHGDPGAMGLPATRGRVSVRALAEGREASALVHVAPPFTAEHEVRLVVGGPETRLAGRVVDREGQAVPGAVLAWFVADSLDGLASGDFTSPSYLSAESDSAGRFSLPGLANGKGSLCCFAPGFAAFYLVRESPGQFPPEIVLERGARVSGTVRWPDGRPAADVNVACEPFFKANQWVRGLPLYDPELRGFAESKRTDEHGRFLLENVKAGPKRALWARDERTGLVASTELLLENGGEARWDAELAERTGLRLRLVDQSGEALPRWFVSVRRPAVNAWWSRRRATDDEGRLFVPDCPDAEIFVDVYSPEDIGASHAWRSMRPSPEEVLIQVEMRVTSTASGCLVDALGVPELRGQLVFQSLNTTQVVSVHRDERGRFEQRLAPGRYRLVLELDRTLARLGQFALKPGENQGLGTLATPPMGTLRLDATALQDASERPAYSIFSLSKEERSSQLVAHGLLEPELLIPMFRGTYRVLAFDGGAKPIVEVVEVPAHAETRVRLAR